MPDIPNQTADDIDIGGGGGKDDAVKENDARVKSNNKRITTVKRREWGEWG